MNSAQHARSKSTNTSHDPGFNRELNFDTLKSCVYTGERNPVNPAVVSPEGDKGARAQNVPFSQRSTRPYTPRHRAASPSGTALHEIPFATLESTTMSASKVELPVPPTSPASVSSRASSPTFLDVSMILYDTTTLDKSRRRCATSAQDSTVIIARSRRASRATGAQPPSQEMLVSFGERLSNSFARVVGNCGLTFVPHTPPARKVGDKSRIGSSYRGPSSALVGREQQRLSEHIYALRKDVRLQQQSRPSWLAHSIPSDSPLDSARVTREAIHANAVANAVTVREQTQGAVIQTTRIDLGGVQRAEIAQKFAVEQALAGARWRLREEGLHVTSPYGAVGLNACASVLLPPALTRAGGVVVGSSAFAYGCMPTTTRSGGAVDEARRLATGELDERQRLISSAFHRQSLELDNLCKSVLRQPNCPFDSNCAAVVLLNYVVSHPRGRELVRLDDRTCKLLEAMEAYWRAENTKRLNQEPRRRALLVGRKRKVAECVRPHVDEDECEGEDEDEDENDFKDEAVDEKVEGSRRRSGGGRGGRSGATRSTTSQGLKSQECLEYWASSTGALGGEHSNVLSTLASGDPEIVELASLQSILQQAPQNECAHDEVLHAVVAQYAERIAHGVDCVLNPAATTTPVPLCFRFGVSSAYTELFGGAGKAASTGSQRAVGFRRVEAEGACTHAFVVQGTTLAPGPDARQTILWSNASWAINARASKVPGALERLALHTDLTERVDETPTARFDSVVSKQRRKQRTENRAGDVRMAAAMQRQPEDTRARKMTPAASGMTRAWVVLMTTLIEYSYDREVATALATEALAVERDAAAAEERHGMRPPAAGAALLLEGKPEGDATRLEVRVQPAATLTVGLRMSDHFFDWQTRMRKEAPVRHLLGPWDTKREVTTNKSVRLFSPPPILLITEWTAEKIGVGAPLPSPLPSQRNAPVEVPYSLAFQVVGERPVRVVDLIDQLLSPSSKALASPAPFAHALALATVGTAQALYIGDVGFHLGTNSVNSEIANSRRIVHTDLTSHDYVDVWCAYVAGRGGMEPSFVGTPWEGVTGAWVDHGAHHTLRPFTPLHVLLRHVTPLTSYYVRIHRDHSSWSKLRQLRRQAQSGKHVSFRGSCRRASGRVL